MIHVGRAAASSTLALTLLGLWAMPGTAAAEPTLWLVGSLDDPGDNNCDAPATCTLREALAAASAGDTIEFAAELSGTILLDAESGPLVIATPLTLTGPGADVLAVSGNGAIRVLSISAPVPAVPEGGGPAVSDVTISGLTISGGATSNDDGAGISNSSNTTLRNMVIRDNTASGGASLALGGGIWHESGDLIVEDSLIAGNETICTSCGTGAAPEGAGANIGGGIGALNGWLEIRRSTIADNESTYGGGIGAFAGVIRITNSTLSGNRAVNGAGVWTFLQEGSDVGIAYSTITANSAITTGGGLHAESFSGLGTLNYSNSIVAGNTAASGAKDCDGAGIAPTSLGFNVIGDGTGCDPIDNLTVDAGSVFTTVLSATLADNGGPTPTHQLLFQSPAIDFASDSASACPDEDQRGYARAIDGDNDNSPENCDVGAIEWGDFVDGFEGGTTCAWDAAPGSGDVC